MAYYVRLIYLPLIFFTIALMVLHNLLDFLKKLQPRPVPPPYSPAATRKPQERMMFGFRLAHWLVMASFPVLVYTGFALKYPEAWWAQPVAVWEAELGLRGWLHRIAGVVLLASIALHFIHLYRNRRAWQCIKGMRPGLEDFRELKHRLLYYIGLEKLPPAGVKLGYIEKAEYLAFLWGMAIMGVTGVLLWFESVSLRWLPSWALDAATAIHFYEAILATLAILVWHLYWVIFDPAVYPMDFSWLTGHEPPARTLERGGVSISPAKPQPLPPPVKTE